ncbi:sugar transferase [Rossellomorea sp. NS-SX7]|uniref:sugar transferase n=1 Tax=Rossellomorea sp. NS-SX7 TaxID=3463856 RepID=UPI00405995B9
MDLAPIILFCYNRPDLTAKTLSSLEKNILSPHSNLYVFVDGPKHINDRKKVEETVKVVKGYTGFKTINIKISSKNQGLANSVISGVSEIIKKYKKVIVLEDDLITHPQFLNFMNDALDFYETEKNIWSISGYSPSLKFPSNYKYDVYLTRRGSSWGWGTWEDKWIETKWNWNVNDYDSLFKSRKELNKIGPDLFYLTHDFKRGLIDSWAIRWTNTQFLKGKYSVFPRFSFIKNVGFEGESTHGSISKRFITELYKSDINYKLYNVPYFVEVEKLYSQLYSLTLVNIIGNVLKKLNLYKFSKKILKKIR